MKVVYLSLGSNVGNTRKNLEQALSQLAGKVHIEKISSFYETEPVGYADQAWFLNIVVKGVTELDPDELMEYCQGIERNMKRVKTIRNGPRIIDIDILLYQDYVSNELNLTVPHPRMTQRAFVMVPLYEIDPDLIINGMPIREIMNDLTGEEIKKVEDFHGKSE